MADFSVAQIGQTGGGGASPTAPVAQPQAATAAIGFVGGLADSLFSSISQAQEERKAQQANTAVAEFTRMQMDIADAVDRGDLSSQEARMRMRANLSSALSNQGTPQLQKELAEAHSKVIGTAGMGKVAEEGTEQEQAFFQVMNEAAKTGFVWDDMSTEEAREGTFNYIRMQQAQQKNKMARDELALAKAQVDLQRANMGITKDQLAIQSGRLSVARGSVGLENDQLKLKQARAEAASRTAIMEGASAYLPTYQKNMMDIQSRVQAGELSTEEADLAYREALNGVVSEMSLNAADVSPSVLENVLTPYRDMAETFQGVNSGKFTTEVLQSELANKQAQVDLQLALDPSTGPIISTLRNFGAAAPVAVQMMASGASADEMIRAAGENARGDRGGYIFKRGERDVAVGYSEYMRNGTRRVNSNAPSTNPEGERDEVRTQVDNILQSLPNQERSADFQDYKPLMDYLSSDDYGQYITGHGQGAVSKTYEAEAQGWLQRFYEDQIRPQIEEEWRNAEIALPSTDYLGAAGTAGEEIEATSVIQPFFTGDGMVFTTTDSSQADNPEVQRKLRRLNNTVAPAMNEFIRIGAHLEEHTNYQKIYEDNYADIFGSTRNQSE